ncbi:MAG TPA: NADPH:quinone reductase [Verrucomicrobiae bacterium]|jgi:NADPH2:quinone reductase|nr:NADPH:quinone reductase [Verrucomicrobiae bacterium]
MKAAYINQTGGPENIIFDDLPDPKPAPNQCLIKVTAVDVNPVDIYLRSGAVPAKLNFPYILGRDLAGKVVATGAAATRFKVGDRVWATGQGWEGRQGTFAELAAVDENWLTPIPGNVTDEDIVAISLVGTTAHVGLVGKAKVKAGEVLFVNGGTGGVGSSVVQMTKLLGARVITTAGSDEKVAKARELGADVVINYKTENVAEAVKKAAPDGVNVWWETLREPDFEKTFSLLAPQGRMIVMAGRDARPVFPVGAFYSKSISLFGFVILSETGEDLRTAAEDINGWMSAGKLKAQIDRVLPLSQAADAHRLQEESTIKKTGTLAGKIILKP